MCVYTYLKELYLFIVSAYILYVFLKALTNNIVQQVNGQHICLFYLHLVYGKTSLPIWHFCKIVFKIKGLKFTGRFFS